jgi:hypothetical protein
VRITKSRSITTSKMPEIIETPFTRARQHLCLYCHQPFRSASRKAKSCPTCRDDYRKAVQRESYAAARRERGPVPIGRPKKAT